MGITTNIGKVRRDLQMSAKNAERFSQRELRQVLKGVFNETQVRVPKLTGALASSGKLTEPGKLRWDIKYGDSNVDRIGVFYAAAVHERHARHAAPTGMKYVEVPLMASVSRQKAAAVRAIRRAMS